LPPPVTIPDTTPNVDQLANNYSFDAIRSRVLGFNLVKSAWYCAEDNLPDPGPPADILSPGATPPNSPPLVGNLNSQIGEDCNYRIESGGWFGFVTAGYSLIEVNNVTVVDDLPDGQGFIPFGGSAYNFLSSTGGILLNGANGGAGTTPLDETDIAWNFNAASGIGVANEFFRVDFKTRLLITILIWTMLCPWPGLTCMVILVLILPKHHLPLCFSQLQLMERYNRRLALMLATQQIARLLDI